MSTAPELRLVSVEEYLASEEGADRKHEYVDGRVYALAGAGRPHNRIAANIIIALGPRARARGCDVFGSDMLLRASPTVFYYPDVQVVCDPADQNDRYTERPCVVIEILSESTKDIDRREKLHAYLTMPSVEAYLIVQQDERRVERHWRAAGAWQLELIADRGVVPIPWLELDLSLDAIYAGPTP
jgi:Uma2 family endonuclease